MRKHLALAVATALVATLPAIPVQAQTRAVTLYGHGGGYSALANLDEAGSSDLKTGFSVGGGVSVDLHRYVALRGDFTYGKAELRSNGNDTGVDINHLLYGAAVQLQYPAGNGVMPYLFGGGGAVTLDEADADISGTTKGAGRFGLGLRYLIPNSTFGIFAEGSGWVYKVSDAAGALAGFDKTQVDVTYSAGISYGFPF